MIVVYNLTCLGLWQMKTECLQKHLWNTKVFSWRCSSFMNYEYSGTVCSIRWAHKDKRNLENSCALLWIEEYYEYFLWCMYSEKRD